MEQKEYWDKVSQQKEFTTPFQTELFEKYVSTGKTVLDVGCGYGRILEELRRAGYTHLIGMDFSKGMIERGKAQFPGLDLRVQEAETIDLPDASMDAVILFAVLTCIRTDEEQQRLLAEIERVLKPGGVVYINDFLLNTDARNRERYRAYETKYGIYGVFALPEGAICRHHREEWIQQLLSGFLHLTYQRLIFTTMNGHTSNGFYFLGRKPCE